METSLAGKRVLVTGGSGFLGSQLVSLLSARGAGEIVVARSREFDLTDMASTERLFTLARPDLVFHLAAKVGGIGANSRHPGTFFRDNMAMGLNVLETARRHATPKVVITGTVCAYPKFAAVPFQEDHLWDGYPEETNAPYGIAKKALLVMAQAYRKEFGSNFVMVFPVNLYGPGDNFDLDNSHVIPAMIRKFVDAQVRGERRVVLWGDGTPSREFLYVADAAEALVLAAERYDSPDAVNLGSGVEITMRDLASTIAQATDYTGELTWDATRPNGQPRRLLDVSRARERFGFVARTSFQEGVAQTISWYRAQRSEIWKKEAIRP